MIRWLGDGDFIGGLKIYAILNKEERGTAREQFEQGEKDFRIVAKVLPPIQTAEQWLKESIQRTKARRQEILREHNQAEPAAELSEPSLSIDGVIIPSSYRNTLSKFGITFDNLLFTAPNFDYNSPEMLKYPERVRRVIMSVRQRVERYNKDIKSGQTQAEGSAEGEEKKEEDEKRKLNDLLYTNEAQNRDYDAFKGYDDLPPDVFDPHNTDGSLKDAGDLKGYPRVVQEAIICERARNFDQYLQSQSDENQATSEKIKCLRIIRRILDSQRQSE